MRSSACLLLMLLTCSAAATEDTPAKQLFTSGLRHYNLSEWKAALDDFKAAYRQRPDPAFLFNIAQCYRQLGDPVQAQNEYRAYLRESPDAPNRGEVERLIAVMDASIRARSQPPSGGTAPAATSPRPPAHTPIDPRTERVAGIALMGAGAALLVVGAVFDAMVYDANAKAGQGGIYQPQQISRRNTFEALDAAAFVIGGATAVTGAVLFALGRKRQSYALAPAVSPAFVGVHAAVEF